MADHPKWLVNNTRHNKTCRYFNKTKKYRYCTAMQDVWRLTDAVTGQRPDRLYC